jgi:AraC-like DNA-binding protein
MAEQGRSRATGGEKKMPGSRASVFGEVEDFQAALGADGVVGLVVTGHGEFRARLTQVELDYLRMTAIQEAQPRIAFVTVPAGMVLVSFPIEEGPSPGWGGFEIRTGEMITFGRGQRLHSRTAGPSRWGAIQAPDQQLARYGRALSGAGFVVPPAARWRPPPATARQLRHLHRAAIRMAEGRAGALTNAQAAHGLEQQLLHALIECLSTGLTDNETSAARRHRGILARFEDLLVAEPSLRMAEICAALGISGRMLRECCKNHLGMGPSSYRRLRRMQQVHRALRSEDPRAASVFKVASRYGIRDLGRFAANYRALYGELPSVTLRRGQQGLAEFSLGRSRMKFL